MTTVEWTDEDRHLAYREGWDIWECADDDHDQFEIQCIDEPDEGCETLADDEAAWRLVVEGAMSGNELHLRALRYVEAYAPEHLIEIYQFAKDEGLIRQFAKDRGSIWPLLTC